MPSACSRSSDAGTLMKLPGFTTTTSLGRSAIAAWNIARPSLVLDVRATVAGKTSPKATADQYLYE